MDELYDDELWDEAKEVEQISSREQDEERQSWPEDLILEEEASPPGAIQELDWSHSTPEKVLRHYWGYEEFRSLQKEIVHSVLNRQDTLGLLPTGGGKSICFQVPGLILPGLTLVITPLISLMKDQVDNLRRRGIKATAIHSGMSSQKIGQTIANCKHGKYKFLYVSPERLGTESFRRQLEHLDISLLVIDECHCICQWGYDFRPSYLNILSLRALIPNVPLLALTATATQDVVREIQRILQFDSQSTLHQKSFFRPNLSYSIRHTNDKERTMVYILSRVPGPAIVYCRTRELCQKIARYLQGVGVSTTFFHAGLSYTEREMRQNRWMSGEVRVMVATNAFGMGIDKPDVRLVLHLMMPSSLEEYFQEAGRAGRDGERSYAVALVADRDEYILRRRLTDTFPPLEYIYKVYDLLCSYLRIGEGEGFGRSYDFEYYDFVHKFKLRPVQPHSALEIMELSGWLSFHQDNTRSRLMFAYTRDQLYQPQVGHDHLLRSILRAYTGLFSDYVFISEVDIARLSGFTPEEVYAQLVFLDKLGILYYIPRKNIPRIVFHIRREDSRYLRITPEAYQHRLERMRGRIEAVISYSKSHGKCRSRLLLEYFGERGSASCGMCDVCLERTSVGLKRYIVEDTLALIEQFAQDQSGPSRVHLSLFVRQLPHSEYDVLTAIQYLLAEERNEGWEISGPFLKRRESL